VIRLCIVENEALVREGLRRVLELDSELEVAGEACDAEQALSVVRAARPDVVLLDMRMPRGGGLRVLDELEREPSAPPCLVLTTFDDADALLAAARAGAKGYLLKDVTAEELGQAIRCLAGGYSNREIGSALGVAERTVKNHVSSILAKLGVRDRTRAVLKALEKRLF